MTLTAEQKDRLDRDGALPLTIDGVACVVLRADVYDRMKTARQPPEPPIVNRWDVEGEGVDVDDYVS